MNISIILIFKYLRPLVRLVCFAGIFFGIQTSVFGQEPEPSFEDLRSFEELLKSIEFNQLGCISGEIEFDNNGLIKKRFMRSYNVDDEVTLQIGHRIQKHLFGNRFKNYKLKYIVTFLEGRADEPKKALNKLNESNADHEEIIQSLASYLENRDYSEFRMIDRYMISKEEVIILPITVRYYGNF